MKKKNLYITIVIVFLVGLAITLKLTRFDSFSRNPRIDQIYKIETHQSVCDLLFSPDGQILLSAGKDSDQAESQNNEPKQVTLSPAYSICLWNNGSGESISRFVLDEKLLAVSFSADGESIITVTGDRGEVSIRDIQTGQKVRSFFTIENTKESSTAEKAAISGDGRYVAVSLSWPGGVQVMNVADGSLAKSISWKNMGEGSTQNGATGPLQGIQRLALSQNGERMLASTGFDWVTLWDIKSAKELHRFKVEWEGLKDLAFSTDGRLGFAAFASPSAKSGAIYVWDLEKGKQLQAFHGHPWGPLCFDTRDRWILSGGRWVESTDWELIGGTREEMGREILLWKVGSDDSICQFFGHDVDVICVAISPDGKRGASADRNGNLLLLKLE